MIKQLIRGKREQNLWLKYGTVYCMIRLCHCINWQKPVRERVPRSHSFYDQMTMCCEAVTMLRPRPHDTWALRFCRRIRAPPASIWSIFTFLAPFSSASCPSLCRHKQLVQTSDGQIGANLDIEITASYLAATAVLPSHGKGYRDRLSNRVHTCP